MAHFVYLGIGSGLGGGAISGGRLLTGAGGNAAEVGHLVLDPEGAVCACGRQGCAETTVSGRGLVRLVEQCLEGAGNEGASELATGLPLTAEKIVAAAGRGDRLARAALGEVGQDLGLVMAACAAVVDPARFVIGGGLGRAAFEWLAPAAAAVLEERTLAGSAGARVIVPSQQASPAVGAASLVWYYR